jgi:hypothetical protein
MERNKALVVAGTVTASILAAAGAFAAALGLFGTASANVGQLDATTVTTLDALVQEPGVTVVYEDVPVAPTAGEPSAGYSETEYGDESYEEHEDEYDEDEHEEDEDDD